MKTRQDYLNGACSHREYYAQFITSDIKTAVEARVGLERLLRSNDPHLNDIRLSTWDALARYNVDSKETRALLRLAGDGYTLAAGVCIAKEAAREMMETWPATT